MNIKIEKPILETHNLTVSYNKKPVLWDIDFTVPGGKIIGIIGPNGSGKTTLIKSMMGIIEPVSGYTHFFGKSLNEIRQKVSYVPQRESVDWDFPASVLDVVLMGRYTKSNLFKKLSKKDHELALHALSQVNLSNFADRQISQLSGGQQQRVFIARSLAQQAELYLMDEPFAGVDAATENAILKLLTKMKEEGKTTIIVHHDLQTAKEFFDWIILLNTRLIASGPIEDVFTQELLQEAYGGRLTLLSKVADLLEKKEFPVREKQKRKPLKTKHGRTP